jgi:hypothetical protein
LSEGEKGIKLNLNLNLKKTKGLARDFDRLLGLELTADGMAMLRKVVLKF